MPAERMECRISDGLAEDYPEIDMTDEWRQMKLDDALKGRIDQAICRLTKSNITDFRDLLALLKDCRRMLDNENELQNSWQQLNDDEEAIEDFCK